MPQPIIQFSHVAKSFGHRKILSDLSFSIYENETFCIVGGSGSGKSVTLKLLMGLEPVTEGQIIFKNRDMTQLKEYELCQIRKQIGMVFQGSALFDGLTVSENISYPLEEAGVSDEKFLVKKVQDILDVVGLPQSADLYPADLSGGMKKRIGLARALITQPQIILFDEPTAGLDPSNVMRIDRLILDLKVKMKLTSILVTHNMESVYRVADRVGFLYDGRLHFIGTLSEFIHSSDPLVQKFQKGELLL